jgi:hypothetical protein
MPEIHCKKPEINGTTLKSNGITTNGVTTNGTANKSGLDFTAPSVWTEEKEKVCVHRTGAGPPLMSR